MRIFERPPLNGCGYERGLKGTCVAEGYGLARLSVDLAGGYMEDEKASEEAFEPGLVETDPVPESEMLDPVWNLHISSRVSHVPMRCAG